MLDEFLGTAMQKPYVRVDALDHLAIEFEHQTQYAMRCWVLRPEVDIEITNFRFGHFIFSRA
jgi:hypothetical protein